ncbi:A24 family peptidase C-terminal domain-containing protein [[Eubacterium] cellulosolvens]
MAMDWWMAGLNATRVIIAILILGIASAHDIKTRTVTNKLWAVLGLVGICFFEGQIILEFGYEAFKYLTLTIPIIILYMSFLNCEWVVNFDSRKTNLPWLFLIGLCAFAFFFIIQFSALDLKLQPVTFIPLILFLLYFMFIESVINYLDYRLYLRVLRRSGPVKNLKMVKRSKRSKGSKGYNGSKDLTTEKSSTTDERIAWSIFMWLLLFHILVLVFGILIPIKIVKVIGLIILVVIPMVILTVYIRNQPEESECNEEPELELSKQDIPFARGIKNLNLLLAMVLVIFGFLLIIYLSLADKIPDIMMQAFAVMIWLLIFYGFYNLGLPRGGADTKALMALMILFPIYPILKNITLQTSFFRLLSELSETNVEFIFPFTFSVLMNAALIVLFVIICIFIFNISKRHIKLPHAFLGYKLPIKEIPNKFVWPMERLVDGKRKLMAFPGKDFELDVELQKFTKAGIKIIWVTPKIPFIVPITIGVVLTMVFGNLLFELILAAA